VTQKFDPNQALGMDQPITRRDFLNGAALLTTVAATPLLAANPAAAQTAAALAAQDAPDYYPPLLTGMRGSHPGSFESAHALRDGSPQPAPTDSGEEYDLIVVGAGISGLSAAHFYRAATSGKTRILLLDNHDDFGGHAKRNEFHLGNQLHLMNGGTLEIDSPRPYSPVAAGLISTLGIDVPKLEKTVEQMKFYERMGLERGIFFDRETFGADKLIVGVNSKPAAKLLASAPLSARAREQMVELQEGHKDYLPGLSAAEKKDRLSRMSYEAYLRDVVQVEPGVIKFYHARTMTEWAVGTDAVSALECWGFGFPGFQGMQLPKGSIARMGPTASGYHDTGGSYHLHFPDGNATIARLLMRDLIPRAVPGEGVENVVTARVNYSQLDRPGTPIRVRLNSTVINVRHLESPTQGKVQVTYLRDGKAITARAKSAVLACYNMMIPYLCPDLPAAQKAALHELVKAPLVYTSVAIRNWHAFDRLNLFEVYAPGAYFTELRLNSHDNIGDYHSVRTPDQPILVHMVRAPCKAGLTEHEQNRVGRAELLATSFEIFERNIRDQLNRTLGPGGFDAARDISAITVNRWPHGYAAEHNPLFEPDVPEAQQPHVIGRARFGRISIANSDAGGQAYTDSAINQAHRAVQELLRA
jgi:spermidine dehydrogenase